MTMPNVSIPTHHAEVIDLPSKGHFYSENSPLAKGQISLYYMTAASEDLLTSRNLLVRGVVIDKLLESLIAEPGVKYDDLLLGDKHAIMIASRILGYGKMYDVSLECPECDFKINTEVDLQQLEDKQIDFSKFNKGINEFSFNLPRSGKVITFKLLTHRDEREVQVELNTFKKISSDNISKEMTTRIRKSLLSVDGDRDREVIRKFVEVMPAFDAKAFREYVKSINPDIDLTTTFQCSSCGYEGRVEIPIDVNFFWPNT